MTGGAKNIVLHQAAIALIELLRKRRVLQLYADAKKRLLLNKMTIKLKDVIERVVVDMKLDMSQLLDDLQLLCNCRKSSAL